MKLLHMYKATTQSAQIILELCEVHGGIRGKKEQDSCGIQA